MADSISTPVVHQFQDFAQRAHAARLGMWIFLATEILLFGGFFALYAAFRLDEPRAFVEGVHHNLQWLGTTNTFFLLVSSYFVARSVEAARERHGSRALLLLAGTLVLGAAFLALKTYEYSRHIREGYVPGMFGPLSRFFDLYYGATALHALHVIAGMSVLGWIAARIHAGRAAEESAHRLELAALFWHLVDGVWIFLWPLFYLLGGSGS